MRDLRGNELVRYNFWLQGALFLVGVALFAYFREISNWLGFDGEWILGASLVLLIQFGLAKKESSPDQTRRVFGLTH